VGWYWPTYGIPGPKKVRIDARRAGTILAHVRRARRACFSVQAPAAKPRGEQGDKGSYSPRCPRNTPEVHA